MAMNAQSVQSAITPLRMIFWGGLLCIFDLTFTQTRFLHFRGRFEEPVTEPRAGE
jgi:hypothetical protein